MSSVTGSRDLRFGVTIVDDEVGIAPLARTVERLGYEYIAVGEHFVRGRPPKSSYATLPLLGVAAGATEKLRVLTSIVLVPFYHPVVLAKLATTLDIASEGRLTLGVGIGGEFPVEFEAVGLDVKQRGRRTNECLEVLRRLWTEEHVSFDGDHFKLDDVTMTPSPAQSPHPPVWVAGRRQPAMVRAARYGDGWYPYFYDPERYRGSVETITRTAKDLGRDTSGFQWGYSCYISAYPTVDESASVAAQVLGNRYLYGGDFIDIVKKYCVLGPIERSIDRLQEYVDAGARYIIFHSACRREDRARQIEMVAREVVPALRERAGLK